MPLMDVIRRLIASLIIASFLVFVCFQGLEWNAKRSDLTFGTNKPDFSNYVFNRTLGEDELALKAGHRAIFVGDIHGQSLALEALLAKLEYDEGKDTLVHTGDIVAKGTLDGSRTVLAFMASHSIHGVRGNHDQKVIEWRAWIEWIRPMEGGAGGRWLDRLEDDLAAHVGDEVDAEEWVDAMKKKGKRKDKKWWDRVPKEWKLLGDHYRIASSMTPEQYTYLKKLPLALHLPSEHAFVVHAGLLPYDLERPMLADGQPLGHAPEESIGDVAARRASQERAVLSDVAQNREPWNVLNMRNVLHDHTVTKDTDRGKSWMSVWNMIMPKCAGFTPPPDHDVEHDKWLPCQPMSVIYGHTASRGLDMHRWTLGIDSGCVYGRRLTGLVLRSASGQAGTEMSMRRASDASEDKAAQEDAKAQQHEVVKFGDSGKARIVSVKCHMHKEHKGTGELPDRI